MTQHAEGARVPRTRPRGQRRLWLLLTLAVAVALFAAYRSPFLRLGEFQVTGNQHLTPQRVMEATGLSMGAPQWENRSKKVEARLRQEPWVLSARARWSWNRLQIHIEERVPMSLLPYQGKWLVLDETGMVLELVESPAVRRVPVISGVERQHALRGERLNHPGLTDALLVISSMFEPLRSQVAEAYVDKDGWITLYMVAGAQVQWGRVPEGSDRTAAIGTKINRFYTFWRDVSKEGRVRCSIDLRIDPRVLATPEGCK